MSPLVYTIVHQSYPWFNLERNGREFSQAQSPLCAHQPANDYSDYKLAAESGNAIAQSNYAVFLGNGYGIPMEKSLSAHYKTLAGDDGPPGLEFNNTLQSTLISIELETIESRMNDDLHLVSSPNQ
jgi:TPR repeat protein